MATWITHLRIAENLLKTYNYDRKNFVLGNIGPDSGLPNEERTKFIPSKEVTHFLVDRSLSDHPYTRISSVKFYKEHVTHTHDEEKKAYVLGYYAHLITDVSWSMLQHQLKTSNKAYATQLEADPSFIWEVKKDWYALDFKYLKQHSNSIYDEFKAYPYVEDHFEFFPPNSLTVQMKYIQDFYSKMENSPQYSGDYLSEEDMNSFVDNTSEYLIQLFKHQKL
jgi:hypothetical protein